uniref:Uncharacterized protein n=1 Tax=Heterorhabditis bacteriophora TaxID=37862 RepID=A0A1I7W9G8_HETBA
MVRVKPLAPERKITVNGTQLTFNSSTSSTSQSKGLFSHTNRSSQDEFSRNSGPITMRETTREVIREVDFGYGRSGSSRGNPNREMFVNQNSPHRNRYQVEYPESPGRNTYGRTTFGDSYSGSPAMDIGKIRKNRVVEYENDENEYYHYEGRPYNRDEYPDHMYNKIKYIYLGFLYIYNN